MSRMLFVNLPVQDLRRSTAFFRALGFAFDEQYTDDDAACLTIGPQAAVMLLVRPFFATFTGGRPVTDPSASTGVILAVSADSRAEVDRLVDEAVRLGATTTAPPQDHGVMYGRSFADLDGHAWEVLWMDPSTLEP